VIGLDCYVMHERLDDFISVLIYSKRPDISFPGHISLLASLILAGWSNVYVEKCSVVVDRF